MIKRISAALIIAWLLSFAYFAVSLHGPAALDVQTDGAVVLTGGAKRIDRGLQILEAGKAKRMLISGVDRDVESVELAKQYNRPVAIFECCIDLGFQAIDTRSNALETAYWVDRRNIKSLRLITHDWHMARALLELNQTLGPDVKVVPDAVATRPTLWVLFQEFNKLWLRWFAAQLGL